MSDDPSPRTYRMLETDAPVLIWQYDNARNWEGHWIRSLLPEAARNEHFDFRR